MQQIVIRDKDREKLREYMPNIDELIAMMCAIDKTLDEDDEATKETLALESIYDRVSYETKIQALERKYNN